MGPDDRALAYFERVIRCDHAIAAVAPGGALLGVAGFRTHRGAFAGGSYADLCAIYGLAGGTWRALALALLTRERETRFLLDGICVDPDVRGCGIGTALIEAICDEARARGFAEVRLDVVDSNFRARALYDRLGFTVLYRQRSGPLGLLFGFSGSTAMVRRVA